LEAVKDLVTSRLSVAVEGVLITKDGGHNLFPQGFVGIFYTHVQDGD